MPWMLIVWLFPFVAFQIAMVEGHQGTEKRILILNLCLTSWSLTIGINRLYHNASKEEEYQRQGAFIQFCYWRLVWFQSILTQSLKMPIWWLLLLKRKVRCWEMLSYFQLVLDSSLTNGLVHFHHTAAKGEAEQCHFQGVLRPSIWLIHWSIKAFLPQIIALLC